MPRRAKRKPAEEHTHIGIGVDRYQAAVTASINHSVYGPQYALSLNDDDSVYEFTNQVTITGTATYPDERAGDTYEFTIYGDDTPSHHRDAKLKDVQARDKYGSPQYRTYHGREIPVYVAPKGLGMLDKVRGEASWRAWLFVAPRS